MSVQFGKLNFDGTPVEAMDLDRVRPLLAPFGPDGENIFRQGNAGILFRACHTTRESRFEKQPNVSPSGAVMTWDGRLDNRKDLVASLHGAVSIESTDLDIVAAAYEQLGNDAFGRLIGDWAISIWNPEKRFLILAKDFVGSCPLYYSIEKDQITWSTVLDPLVLFLGRSCLPSQEYIAGWLSSFPLAVLTPYEGISSVPPACFVLLQAGKHTTTQYWEFDPRKKISYKSDREYEEHFRAVFARAIARRLRSDKPIVAELSGGMDSSSIVCMADTILGQAGSLASHLDTVSYFDDSEPHWNERQYFAKVEERRGRAGCHIDVGAQSPFNFEGGVDPFVATPASAGGATAASTKFADYMVSRDSRVILSGVGGDEVTGGVPTPVPRLADLLARGHLRELSHELKLWALQQRRPWFHLLFDTAKRFFPPLPAHPAPWLDPLFVRRNREALAGYEPRVEILGPLPSFQENLLTLDALRRQLSCETVPSKPPLEKRYPYLDRDFLEYLYAVPRAQLMRPGQRRSLMRRALAGIVPNEILNRRRKAFVSRAPLAAIGAQWPTLTKMTESMLSASLGIVNAKAFAEALDKARRGEEVPIAPLLRTLAMESWLRGLEVHGIVSTTRLSRPSENVRSNRMPPLANVLSEKNSAS